MFDPAAYDSGEITVELDLWDADGNEATRAFVLPTRSSRPRVLRVDLDDIGSKTIGNADGQLQAGETVRFRVVVDSVANGMVAALDSLSGFVDRWDAVRSAPFERDGDAVVWAASPRFTAARSLAPGDTVRLLLASRALYATFRDTLEIPVSQVVDLAPPQVVGPAFTWQGDGVVAIGIPVAAVVEDQTLTAVQAVVTRENGRQRFVPLTDNGDGAYVGVYAPPGPGTYELAVEAIDGLYQRGRSALQSFHVSDFAESAEHVIIGGTPTGTPTGLGYHTRLADIGAMTADGATLYVADTQHRVWRWEPTGVLQRMAGSLNGQPGLAGDGGPPRQALLNRPSGLAVDGGALIIADTGNHRVRRLSDGVINTMAGTEAGFSGDLGPAREARLREPTALVFWPGQGLFVCDSGNGRVRRIYGRTGTISTVAGGGRSKTPPLVRPVSLLAHDMPWSTPVRLLISDEGAHRIWQTTWSGTQTGAWGDGTDERVFTPGTPAVVAGMTPRHLVEGLDVEVVYYDARDSRLRRVDVDGAIWPIDVPDPEAITAIATDRLGHLFVARMRDGYADVSRVALSAESPTVVAESHDPAVPDVVTLHPGFPNPFNAATVLTCTLDVPGPLDLVIYDLLGQRVVTLARGWHDAGHHSVTWDGRDALGRRAAAGVYLACLRAAGRMATTKLLLLP